MAVGVSWRATPAQGEAPRRETDPRPQDGWVEREQALDQPDAGGTIESIDQQVEGGLICT